MFTLLYTEVNIFTMILLCIVAVKTANMGFEKSIKSKLFLASVNAAFLMNVFDFLYDISVTRVWVFHPHIIWFFNAMYFASFGALSFFWFWYAEVTKKKKVCYDPKKLIVSALPLAVLLIFLVATFFTRDLFYIDNSGIYHRGKWFFVPGVMAYGYIAYATLSVLMMSMEKKNYAYRKNLLTVAGFAVPVMICGIGQLLLQELPLISAGMGISFLLVYINSLQSLVSQDPLTGIHNRRELLIYLAAKTETLKQGESLYFLFIDVDFFKKINDSYGHTEGDYVLKLIADVLKEIGTRRGGFCARYGGDEFALALLSENDADITALRSEIENNIKKKNDEKGSEYPLCVSVGYAKFDGSEDIENLILRADHSMYREKERKRLYAQ